MMATCELCSLGYLSVRLQIGYARLDRVVRDLGIAPSSVIDGVPRYDEAAVARIRRELERQGHRRAGRESDRG